MPSWPAHECMFFLSQQGPLPSAYATHRSSRVSQAIKLAPDKMHALHDVSNQLASQGPGRARALSLGARLQLAHKTHATLLQQDPPLAHTQRSSSQGHGARAAGNGHAIGVVTWGGARRRAAEDAGRALQIAQHPLEYKPADSMEGSHWRTHESSAAANAGHAGASSHHDDTLNSKGPPQPRTVRSLPQWAEAPI